MKEIFTIICKCGRTIKYNFVGKQEMVVYNKEDGNCAMIESMEIYDINCPKCMNVIRFPKMKGLELNILK